MPVVALAWSSIELVRDAIAVGLREVLHADALREVLPNQAVHVLVRAAFPGVMRCGEVELDRQARFEGFVTVELGAIVRRDGAHGAPKRARDLGLRAALLAQLRQGISFVRGDLGVRRHGDLSLGGGWKPSVPQVTLLGVRRVALSM